ncbi:MAG: PQQ-dependent sugar dehydrogenase [Gammaproteobacteria bacterium]|jgi:glucose/arabinose dehydrogenase
MLKRVLLVAIASLPGVAAAQDLFAPPPMSALPQIFESSDYTIRIVEVAAGLSNPWSLAFVPNGDILIVERVGALRIVRDGVLDPQPIAGTPEVHTTILGGLLDVVLHPQFADNDLVYLSYSKAMDATHSTTAVARAELAGDRLRGLEEIFVANTRSTSPTNFGGRMVFGPDGRLYLTVGERQEQDRAQDTMDHGGKVLRLNDDGSAPADNPFYGRAGYQPEIYTLGHRSPQGLAVNPRTGALWENEHGPLGGDEINILIPGANYGWPLVSYGMDYDGTQITETGLTAAEGLEPPFMYWVPSIAISGLSFYTGDAFELWQGNAFVGSMMTGRIRWTGHVQRLSFNEAGRPITREPLLGNLRQRIRDVRPGPDGFIYVLTDQNPGYLLRLEPIGGR